MPTVSVKLSDATKQRVDQLALSSGTSPHALMVLAIEDRVASLEAQDTFVRRALRSRQLTEQGGPVWDGPVFAAYLRSRARGQGTVRPEPKSLVDAICATDPLPP